MAQAEINCAVFVLICVNVALVSPEMTRGATFVLLQSESKHAASASCCWRVTLRERSLLLSGEVSSQLNQPAVSLSKLDCLTYVASMLSKKKK